MIAIHSALYIFKPRVSSGEGGLYPYRKLAYTVWLVYPILMVREFGVEVVYNDSVDKFYRLR